MKIKSDVLLKKGKHGYEAWQTNKLLAKVPGFDEDSKDRIMKYIPTYENVIEESLDKRIVSGYQQNEKSLKAVLSSRTFDDVELQILFDNIIGGQDEMFFEWYTDKYGELPWDNLKSIPKERIAEYVNENPDVLEDMEYEISISKDDYAAGNTLDKNINDYLSNSKKPIKSSTLKDLDEYIAEDHFCERYALDNYIVDKLIEMGFTSEQVEFEWDSPMVKKARNYLEDLWWDEKNENFSRSYSDWAENLILNDKFETEEYKRWILNKELRKEYPDGVYEDKDGSYMKRIKELSTEIDNNITNAKRKLKSGVYVPDSTGVSEEDKAHNEFMDRYSFDPARNTFPGPESY